MGTYRRARRRPPQAATRPDGGAKRGGSRRGDVPRRTAYDVLAAVEEREAYANLLLPKLLTQRSLSGRDAALATELTYGTLRGLGTYDAVLAACSDRPLDKLDPPVRQVLRLGTHQLLSTRVGSHAAVATSVDLAKAVVGPRVSGYVNAVLRRVATRDAEQWTDLVSPARETDPDGYLAVRYSHPRWIIGAYREALGDAAADEIEAALTAGNERPRVTMAVLPGGPDRDAVLPDGATASRWSPYGFTLPGGDPAGLIEGGRAAVQDEASQLAAIVLSRVPVEGPDEAWLDMCAGPGGKARMLYGLAGLAGANLVASDMHPHRAGLIKQALDSAARKGAASTGAAGNGAVADGAERRGGQSAVLVADGRVPPWREGGFDRVLVDVPCSGLGALRRRPEARWRKSEADLPALGDLQRALLRSALAAVRPGGVVAYVTCSPVPAETSGIVESVLGETGTSAADAGEAGARGTGAAEILDAPAVLSQVPDLRAPDPRFAQFWPHRHGTDAIFLALLRRK
jgi:16S rRNA (cytosine967-C5)-methyltransferase